MNMTLHRVRAALRLCLHASLLFSTLAGIAELRAQATETAVQAGATHTGDSRLSPVMGLNLSVASQGEHSSAVGWNSSISPDLSYRLNRHFLFDVNAAWYPLFSAYVQTNKKTGATALRTSHSLLGDTAVAAHYEAGGSRLSYIGTALMGLPTGNVRYGLGANQVTYNFTNDLDYSIGPFTPEIEIGEGDNSSFANPAVHKAYVAVGHIANFQAGTGVDLPFNLSLDLRAYENLPIGDQNVHGTVTKKGKKGQQTSTTVLEGKGAAEDNGFNAELDLPLGNHCLFLATYERSLIQGLDTAAVGVTWTLRTPKAQ